MADARDRILRRAALLSVVVGLLVLVLKVGAYVVTGSAAILSDALESVVHVFATVFMWWALRVSQTPPDEHHPYGHGKAASFSIGLEGGLVALSGLLVYLSLIDRLINERTIVDLPLGLAGTIVAAVINAALGGYLIWVGRKHRNEVLQADGQHVLADMWTSVGVIVGLILVQLTGWQWLDLLTAALVAGHLVVVGWRLVRKGFAGLMDEMDPADVQTVVDAINQVREADWYDVHCLRVHRVGELAHVDFHLTVPGDWSVARGHAANERLERCILQALQAKGTVIVHLDIAGSEAELADPQRYPALLQDFTAAGALRWLEGAA